MASTDEKNQKRRDYDEGEGDLVCIRVSSDVAAALDTYVVVAAVESRPAAINEIVREFLKRGGLLT
jgi:hypothetical protein